MHRKTILTLATAITALASITAIGCGGTSEPTPEQFIKQAEKVDQQHEAIAQPLWDQLDADTADLTPDQQIPSNVRDTLDKLFRQEDDFADAVAKLDAPESAKAMQQEAVAALHDEAAVGRKIMTSSTTFGDVMSAFEGDEAVKAQVRRHAACESAQKYADDNGVTVDMTC
jgi:hypothetical protein